MYALRWFAISCVVAGALACETEDGDDGSSGATTMATAGTGSTGAPGCTEDDEPPECYDQGPGECADATLPARCENGEWTCPNGFGLGGYGAGCCWEPGC